MSWMGKDDCWFESKCMKIPFIRKMLRAIVIEDGSKIKNPEQRRNFFVENIS